MTRFAWLQSRTQTLVTTGAMGVLVVAAALTGVQLSHLAHSLLTHCQTGCDLATSQFLSHQRFMQHALDLLSLVVPALFGVFWGAPLLARELETGTYRLAWTQSVSRSRWLATKLAIGAAATIVLAGALTLTITWWYRSVDPVSTTPYQVFDRRDIVPIAYAAFAFALGAFLGAVIKRSLPAMATTLGVYVFVRIAMSLWVRPHLLAPLHKTISLLQGGRVGFESSNGGPIHLVAKGQVAANSWTLASRMVDHSGHVPSSAQMAAFLHQNCPELGPPPGAQPGGHSVAKLVDPTFFDACQAKAAHAFNLLVSYQPANRYWTFQWLEAGIFAALALLAMAACYWWVTRRAR